MSRTLPHPPAVEHRIHALIHTEDHVVLVLSAIVGEWSDAYSVSVPNSPSFARFVDRVRSLLSDTPRDAGNSGVVFPKELMEEVRTGFLVADDWIPSYGDLLDFATRNSLPDSIDVVRTLVDDARTMHLIGSGGPDIPRWPRPRPTLLQAASRFESLVTHVRDTVSLDVFVEVLRTRSRGWIARISHRHTGKVLTSAEGDTLLAALAGAVDGYEEAAPDPKRHTQQGAPPTVRPDPGPGEGRPDRPFRCSVCHCHWANEADADECCDE